MRNNSITHPTELNILLDRHLPGGGFSNTIGGVYRPDATAWAIICLETLQAYPAIVSSSRARLVAGQMPDGRISVATDHPDAFWPTAIAIMALHGDSHHASAQGKAVDFLLSTAGTQFPKGPGSPLGHDTNIPGWSWIDQTHSWVEPTAMAIRALALAGKADHERVRQGVRLLLDRQLPDGGWNYGNTTVYGKALNPLAAATGIALWSLVDRTDAETVNASLDLLEKELPGLRTPLSLGWALLGLKAWNRSTPTAEALVRNCLERQGRYSMFATSQLSVLLTGASCCQRPRSAHV